MCLNFNVENERLMDANNIVMLSKRHNHTSTLKSTSPITSRNSLLWFLFKSVSM